MSVSENPTDIVSFERRATCLDSCTKPKTDGPISDSLESSCTKPRTDGQISNISESSCTQPRTDEPILDCSEISCTKPKTDGPILDNSESSCAKPGTDGPILDNSEISCTKPGTDVPILDNSESSCPKPRRDGPISESSEISCTNPRTEGPILDSSESSCPKPRKDGPISESSESSCTKPRKNGPISNNSKSSCYTKPRENGEELNFEERKRQMMCLSNMEILAERIIKSSIEEALTSLPPLILITDEPNTISLQHEQDGCGEVKKNKAIKGNKDLEDFYTKKIPDKVNQYLNLEERANYNLFPWDLSRTETSLDSNTDLYSYPPQRKIKEFSALKENIKNNENLDEKTEYKNEKVMEFYETEECRTRRSTAEQRDTNYDDGGNILEEDNYLDFSNQIELLRKIKNSTLDLTKNDDISILKSQQNTTPRKKKKQILKSPLTKRKEIKKLFQNHKDCENSDILEEIFKPVTNLNKKESIQTQIDYYRNPHEEREFLDQDPENISEKVECPDGCLLHQKKCKVSIFDKFYINALIK